MSPIRTCTRCGASEDAAEFPLRETICLPCRRARGREHYRNNKQYYLTKARRRRRVAVQKARAWLVAYLNNNPCADCGIADIRVLEFDHRDPELKRTAVTVLVAEGTH